MRFMYLASVHFGLIFVLSALAEQSRQKGESFCSLRELTEAALANNPNIQAALARWSAAKERVPQARAWEDLQVGADFERFGTTRFNKFTDIEYMILQKIPVSGKNRSQARIAEAEALQAFESLRRKQLDVVAQVRKAYLELGAAQRQLEVNDRNRELLQRFADITRTRYEVGKQSQVDVALAETELQKLMEQREDLDRQLSDAQTSLNVLVNRDPHTPTIPAHLQFLPLRSGTTSLEQLALANRPEIHQIAHQVAGEKAKLQLAKRQWFPDPEVRLETRQFEGQSGIQDYDTGVFFNVPWVNYRKYSAQQREAENGIAAAQQELGGAMVEAKGMVRDQLKKVTTSLHHFELYRDRLLPLANQAVDAALADYQTDKSTFLDVITAQRNLQDIDSALVNHLADYLKSLADLESVVGADLGLFDRGARGATGK
jgi:outer membrane protein TolC